MTSSEELKPLGQRMLAAIMFTDVAGFSRLMGEHEEQTMAAVHRDLHLISNLCAESNGKVLKIMGDGILVLFYSAVRAVECAQEIQRQLTEQARTLPKEDVLRHRIGIHLGDIYVQEDEVMGDGVNIAARLQMEAPPGGICISKALYEVVRRRLSLHTVHCGAKHLKNIKEEVHIYQIMVGNVAIRGRSILPNVLRHHRSRWVVGGVVIVLFLAAAFLLSKMIGVSPRGEVESGEQSSDAAVSADAEMPPEVALPETVSTPQVVRPSGDLSREGTEKVNPSPSSEEKITKSTIPPGRIPPHPPDSADVRRFPPGRGDPPPGLESLSRPHGEADLFSRFDRNHDGKLAPHELPARARPTIMRADRNHDGAVTLKELQEAIEAKRRRQEPPTKNPSDLEGAN